MIKQSVKALTIEEYELCNKLKSMRFSGMAAELERVFANPNADLMTFNDKIQRIVDAEWDLRYTQKLNRFIKKATLKYTAALSTNWPKLRSLVSIPKFSARCHHMTFLL